MLLTGEVLVVNADLSCRDEGDLNSVAYGKGFLQLRHSHGSLLFQSVPNSPVFRDGLDGSKHNGVVILARVLLGFVRFREHEHGQCQVNERVLEVTDLVFALHELVNLRGDGSSNHGSGGGDGRDDLSGNHLGLLPFTLSDLVVPGSEIGGGVDEVDMEVRVVVLLKVRGFDVLGVNAGD